MTTKEKTRKDAGEYFPAMLRIAVDLGCDIQQDPEKETVLSGICPFHDTGVKKARTLRIDAKSKTFACPVCNARGNPYAFAAKVWQVTATDAHTLLEAHGQHVGATRPAYPKPEEGERRRRGGIWMPEISNTALLTRAMRRFEKNLFTNYPALRTLAKLGIDPHDAAKAGIGYCDGENLREWLTGNGIADEELAASPLFRRTNGAETFADKLVLGDLDFTGGCIWMTSLDTQEGTSTEEWKRRRPGTYGIPGIRPEVMNLYSVTPHTKTVVITDDARLYMVMASQKMPVTLITKKRRRINDIADETGRYARGILRRSPERATLIMHDQEVMQSLAEQLQDKKRGMRVRLENGEAAMKELDPASRDLEGLIKSPRGGTGSSGNPWKRASRLSREAEADAQPASEPGRGNSDGSSPGTVNPPSSKLWATAASMNSDLLMS